MKRRHSKRLLAIALLVGSVAGGSLGLAAPYAVAAPAPDGFDCDGQVFGSAGDQTTTQLYTFRSQAGVIVHEDLGPTAAAYNAIGVDPDTQYLFAMKRSDNHLLQINNTGAVKDLGAIAGLPDDKNYYIGAFDADGNYYVIGNETPMYKIDVDAREVIGSVDLSASLGEGMGDITYAGGEFWGASSDGIIHRIDPATGKVSNFAGITPFASNGYGGAYTYGNGDLGLYDNNGIVYRIEVKNADSVSPTFTLLSQRTLESGSAVDAAACFVARADLKVVKTAAPNPVEEGKEVTYRITVTNSGPAASSGWTITDPLPTTLQNPSSTTPGCAILNGDLSCTGGKLEVGESATVTVTGTAPTDIPPNSSAINLDNCVTVRGNDPDPNPANDNECETVRVLPIPVIDPAVGGVAGTMVLGAIGTVLRRRKGGGAGVTI